MPRVLAFVVAPMLAGCVFWGRPPTRYDREAFDHEQEIRVLGCAVLGFSLAREDVRLLLDVSLKNRCVRGVGVDLSALRVTSRDATGAETSMTLHDPRHEVRAYQLDALADGTERFQLDSESGDARVVCVDLARVSAEAVAARPSRVCLDTGPL